MLMGLGILLFFQTLPNRGGAAEGPARLHAEGVRRAVGTGNLEGDANVCQKAPTARAGRQRPACSVPSAEVVNLCELRKKPLVLTFIFDRGADCYPRSTAPSA